TGAGNLFMVFGEPDIDIRRTKDGEYEVEVKGIDVYDPTTGQVRSHTTDDIATWFVDTNYDGNSFFVRHAYFLGGDDPYEKLKRESILGVGKVRGRQLRNSAESLTHRIAMQEQIPSDRIDAAV